MGDPRRIERDAATLDERLPYPIYMALARREAESFPLEIIEDGVTYQAVDTRLHINGYLGTMIVIYQEVEAEGNQ